MSEAGTEAYSASKGGLLSLTHAMAMSLGPMVRVNAVSPGWINSAGQTLSAGGQFPTPHGACRHLQGRRCHGCLARFGRGGIRNRTELHRRRRDDPQDDLRRVIFLYTPAEQLLDLLSGELVAGVAVAVADCNHRGKGRSLSCRPARRTAWKPESF